MIPKIAHFYWGGPILPYLRFMTIKSFCRFNPDWEVWFYTPKHDKNETKPWPSHEQKYETSGEDYSGRVEELGVHLAGIGPIEEQTAGWSQVHKSDLWRWWILSTIGGLWSDMDILYIRPIKRGLDLSGNTYVCSNPRYGHSIGFLLSSGINKFYSHLYKAALLRYTPSNYQSIGSILINAEAKHLPQIDPSFRNIPMEVVYAYDALTFPEIYKNPAPALKFTWASIGLHWYAGHPMAALWINTITEKDANRPDNILCNVLKVGEGK